MLRCKRRTSDEKLNRRCSGSPERKVSAESLLGSLVVRRLVDLLDFFFHIFLDIARGLSGARAWDDAVSRAKANLDWEKMLSLCVDPEKARRYRASLPPSDDGSLCSMCGEFCAIKRSKAVK